MEADPELIEVKSLKSMCITSTFTCYYDGDQPGDTKCGRGSYPCNGRPIIFVPKLEYLTWKLTQS